MTMEVSANEAMMWLRVEEVQRAAESRRLSRAARRARSKRATGV
jgi:hypothetical protein